MIDVTDLLMIALAFILILVALLLACAVAIVLPRDARIVRRGAARSSSLSAAADDPFFHPFGEVPTVPRERLMVARDFRAWGIPRIPSFPEVPSAGEIVQVRTGARPYSNDLDFPGTGVVLAFPKRGA